MTESESTITFGAKQGVYLFISIIITAVLVFVTYILYKWMKQSISNKELWVVPTTKIPIIANTYTTHSGGNIPTNLNGKRMSFSFWIYISDISKYSGSYRHVLHRGDEEVFGASPLVMMDKTMNRLYIRFAGNDATVNKSWEDIITYSKMKMGCSIVNASGMTCGSDDIVSVRTANNETVAAKEISDLDAIKYDLATHGAIVDYVPLQRWVHIAVVINEDSSKGTIQLYMDGEIIKSVSSNESEQLSNGTTVPYNFQNLKLSKKGDIWIGGSSFTAAGMGFSGMVTKVSFMNYNLTSQEVYDEYLKGPVDNLTSKLGLPAYVLRSPIYKIDV